MTTREELEQLRAELDSIATGADIHEVKSLAGLVWASMNYPSIDLDYVAAVVRAALKTRDFSWARVEILALLH